MLCDISFLSLMQAHAILWRGSGMTSILSSCRHVQACSG